MVFLNMTESIGIIVVQSTSYTTGSIFLTLLIIMLIIVAAAMMFGISLEYTAIIIFPLLLAYMTQYTDFVAIGAVVLIYLSLVFTQKFILH